jgi:tight adherence protein B
VFSAFAVLLFAAVILMIEGVWLWWSGAHGRGAAHRQALAADGGQRRRRSERVDILKRRIQPLARAGKLLRRIAASLCWTACCCRPVSWSVAQFLGSSLAAMAAGLLLPRAALPLLPGLACLLLAACLAAG